MKLSEYQEQTAETAAPYKSAARTIAEDAEENEIDFIVRASYLGLGLASEAGEVAGKIKKIIRDDNLIAGDLIKELGDVCWYVSELCSLLRVSFEEVLEANIEKLAKRKANNTLQGDGDAR
jgi:NTP pyrophosphatase (non-canonical NTP hydrolase)